MAFGTGVGTDGVLSVYGPGWLPIDSREVAGRPILSSGKRASEQPADEAENADEPGPEEIVEAG
jgi:hypothetical protein